MQRMALYNRQEPIIDKWAEKCYVDAASMLQKHAGEYSFDAANGVLEKIEENIPEIVEDMANILKNCNNPEINAIHKFISDSRINMNLLPDVLGKCDYIEDLMKGLEIIHQFTSPAIANETMRLLNKHSWKKEYLEIISGCAGQMGTDKQDVHNILMVFDHSTDILNMYETNSKEVAYAVSLLRTPPGNGIQYAKVFGSKEVIEAVEKHGDITEFIAEIRVNSTEKVTIETAKVCSKYDRDGARRISSMIDTITEDDKLEGRALQVLEIFDRYRDNNWESFWRIISNYMGRLDKAQMHQLQNQKTYDKIKNAKNPYKTMLKIIENDYEALMLSLDDEDFALQLKYEDMDLVFETYKIIEEIHKKRSEEDRFDVHLGFYEELNRAISQGNNYKSKLKNMKQFCKEVQKAMKDNALDLMVVNNA